MKYFAFIFAIAVLLLSFSRDPRAVISASRDPENGLIRTFESGDFSIHAQLKHTDFIVAEYMIRNDHKDHDIEDYRNMVDDKLRIDLRFKVDHCADFMACDCAEMPDYHHRNAYYGYELAQDVRIISNEDTIHCALSMPVYTYGIVPYFDAIVEFPVCADSLGDEFTLELDDQLTLYGTASFKFYKNDIQNAPSL